MPAETNGFSLREPLREWGPYLAKGCLLFVALLLLGRFVSLLPSIGVALSWAALSAVLALGLAYHAVMRKARNQFILKGGGFLARMNSGRFISLLVACIAAAVCVAGIIMEAPKWGVAVWVALALAIPLYPIVYARLKAVFANEYEPLFQPSKAVLASNVLVCAALCLVYALLCMLEPVGSYANVTEAFVSVKQPFEASPSPLLAESGRLVALVDAVTAYGMAKTAEVSFGFYLVWRVAICISAFFGVAGLLGACVLPARELRRVFLPLDAMREAHAVQPLIRRYVVIAGVLPVLLVIGYLAADFRAAEVAATEEYTAAQSFVRQNAGMATRVLDGKFYDDLKAGALIDEAAAASSALAEERETVLTPLINKAFDKRVSNVDAYLDWYYSLPADYERLLQYFSGTVESGMRDQLVERINEGVDDSALSEKMGYYYEQSQAIATKLHEEIADYEVRGIPEWLLVPKEPLDSSAISGPLEPTQRFLDAGARMGISAGAGAIAGIVSKKVVERIAAKPVFKKIVSGLLEKLALRGLLAAGGTAIAPGVGTAIGVGVGVATDYLLLKADEAVNRAGYRDELVASIEESRNEMLDMVRAA